MFRKTCSLLHKKCKLGTYVEKEMPKNANVICESSLSIMKGGGIIRAPAIPTFHKEFYDAADTEERFCSEKCQFIIKLQNYIFLKYLQDFHF